MTLESIEKDYKKFWKRPTFFVIAILCCLIFTCVGLIANGYFGEVGRQLALREADRESLNLAPQKFTYKVIAGREQDKNYLGKSPIELWVDVENLNPEDRDAFIQEKYTGKWIAFSAPVHYVYISKDKEFGFVDFDNGIMKVRMSFVRDPLRQLSNLRKGAQVSVQGKFNAVWEGYANFTESNLLD